MFQAIVIGVFGIETKARALEAISANADGDRLLVTTIMRGDGDPTASRWPMGDGEEALLVRYHTGHGAVATRDQVQFEIAAAYRHYHAALMYVILTGEPDPRHRHMFDACAEALDACGAVLRPGNTVGQVFSAHTGRYVGASVSAALTTLRRVKVDSIVAYFWTPAKP